VVLFGLLLLARLIRLSGLISGSTPMTVHWTSRPSHVGATARLRRSAAV